MVISRTSVSAIRALAILPVVALLTYACISSTGIRFEKKADGGEVIEVTFEFEPEEGEESEAASSVFETREVDPNLYANDPDHPHSGTLTLTLDDGTTVSHSQGLYYDSTTAVSPVTSGHEALAYRPVNPSALQSFLDQYWSRATSAKVTTRVGLQDLSTESTSTTVDIQASAHDQLQYVGTGSVTTSGSGPLQKDF